MENYQRSKKKPKPNGFLMFMLEYKRNNEIPSMNQAQIEAGREWEKMTSSEREPYLLKAGKAKAEEKGTEPKKFTSFGWSLDELEQANLEKKKKEKKMELDIASILEKNPTPKGLKSLEFFIISASHYCKKGEDAYPAEIGLSRFSFSSGVVDKLHIKVNPGPVPLGYAAEAKRLSELTHSYPTIPISGGEKDYTKIYSDIVGFFGGNLQPLFTLGDEMETVISTLDKITVQACQNINFRVYPLENLFFKFDVKLNSNRISGVSPMSSINMARTVLLFDPYQHFSLGCDFHQNLDKNNQCAYAKAQRWGYTMAKQLLHPEHDEVYEGKQLPLSSSNDNEQDEVVSTSSKITSMSSESRICESMSSLDIRENLSSDNIGSIKPPSLASILKLSASKRGG